MVRGAAVMPAHATRAQRVAESGHHVGAEISHVVGRLDVRHPRRLDHRLLDALGVSLSSTSKARESSRFDAFPSRAAIAAGIRTRVSLVSCI